MLCNRVRTFFLINYFVLMSTRDYGSSSSIESPLLGMASGEEVSESGGGYGNGGNRTEKETSLYHRGSWGNKSPTARDDFVNIEVGVLQN